MAERPSLLELERLVAGGRAAEALQLIRKILEAIDSRRGDLGGVMIGPRYAGASEEDVAVVFATALRPHLGSSLSNPICRFQWRCTSVS
jgi:hypothetical protein